MEDTLYAFAQLVLEEALPLLAVALVGLVAQGVRYLGAKIKEANPGFYFQLSEAARFAVNAAEQSGLMDDAFDKKDYAVAALAKLLKGKGIKLDLIALDALIEAAVLEMNLELETVEE